MLPSSSKKNKIFLIEMVCPSENNVDAKHAEKLQKYQQLAFKIRDRRPGYNGFLGEGMRRVANQTGRLTSGEKNARAISNEIKLEAMKIMLSFTSISMELQNRLLIYISCRKTSGNYCLDKVVKAYLKKLNRKPR